LNVLLDTCVWGGALAVLRAAGHRVEWVGEWPTDPGDEEILRHATASTSVLVTLDKDFGELAVIRGTRHCGILRLVGLRGQQQAPACLAALLRYGEELTAGAIVTVEPGRVRFRPAPSRE
jgi:predicted nuclease of predicted toxin-antitoxin system